MSEKTKILIIDDDQFIVKVTKLMLANSGYTVETAADWSQGIRMWLEGKPDLVLLDLMMPDKSGWEILEEMRSKEGYIEIPVIIFTASEVSDTHEEAQEHGVWGVISKPFDQSHLLSSIEEALTAVKSKH